MTPAQAQALHNTEWMTADPPTEWPTIREQIITMISTHPRSLQAEPGPSELGTTCLRCLAHRLNGDPKRENPASQWAPTVGTGGHLLLQQWFDQHPGQRTVNLNGTEVPVGRRWEAEKPVITGMLHHHGQPVKVGGHIDLWDAQELATIDWKFVGQSTLNSVKRHGPSQSYKVQASLYGIGIRNMLGFYPVRSCVYYLPRSARNLDEGYAFETRYDPRPGEWALSRAQQVYDLLGLADAYGCTRETIDRLPSAGGDCFTCTSGAYQPMQAVATPPSFGELLAVTTPETLVNAPQTVVHGKPLPQDVQDMINGIHAVYAPCITSNTTN